MPCRVVSRFGAAAWPLAVVVLLTAGLSQSALADNNNSTDVQGDISLRGSLRGQCKSQNAICGSHGRQTALCCRGLKCQEWFGTFEMRCVDRQPSPGPSPSPPPTPPPTPQCKSENALCGSHGRPTARCCGDLKCQEWFGTFEMRCVSRQPSPGPSPTPPPAPTPPSASRFEIRWAGQSNTCMDVPGGRDENFNQMQVFACDYPQNQQFYFEQAPGRNSNYGQFRWAKDASKCLDIKDGNTANFAKVELYSCHPSNHPDFDHQVFHVDSFSGWTYIRWHNKCVDLKDGIVGSFDSRGPKSEVITYDCHPRYDNDYIHQQWYMEYRV